MELEGLSWAGSIRLTSVVENLLARAGHVVAVRLVVVDQMNGLRERQCGLGE